MRLRNIPGAGGAVRRSKYVIQEPKQYKGRYTEVFGNSKPIRIEIGMGKGKFIIEMAKRNPDVSFIGIEMYASVLYRALQKMEKLEKDGEAPQNLRFICINAKELSDVFGPEEIDKIYLNFSDPWPKLRHSKRRLPSRNFLRIYDTFLKKDGFVEFKTDNEQLFDFALSELPEADWMPRAIIYNLHQDSKIDEDEVLTEYEEKFVREGKRIYKYIIRRNIFSC